MSVRIRAQPYDAVKGKSWVAQGRRHNWEMAEQKFETSADNLNEVMYNVGYNDPKAFRNTFKRFTCLASVDYRHKYNKELAAV